MPAIGIEYLIGIPTEWATVEPISINSVMPLAACLAPIARSTETAFLYSSACAYQSAFRLFRRPSDDVDDAIDIERIEVRAGCHTVGPGRKSSSSKF